MHVRALALQRAPDVDVVARARADSSVVLTFDLDFGDVLALGVLDKPSVIIFRRAAVLNEQSADLEPARSSWSKTRGIAFGNCRLGGGSILKES